MSDSSIKNYIDYVQNVLGVKKVFYAGSPLEPASLSDAVSDNSNLTSAPIQKNLVISVFDFEAYTDAETDLLEKMVAALKLNSNDYILLNPTQVDDYVGTYYLHFVDDPTQAQSTDQHVFTYSPRRLLKQAALKKEAWTVMQNLIQKVKASV